jgi:hypothetical protein
MDCKEFEHVTFKYERILQKISLTAEMTLCKAVNNSSPGSHFYL